MEKWIVRLLAAVLCLSLVACGSGSAGATQLGLDELSGYWVADDGGWFHVYDYGSILVFDGPYFTNEFDYATEGNKLILSADSETKLVYEVTQGEETCLIRYLPEESHVLEDASQYYSVLYNDFSVYPESSTHTVELTLDNWADYLEFQPTCRECYNSFDELTNVYPDGWFLCLKKDAPHIVVGVADAAVEYRLTGGFCRWFHYDLATKELTIGEPAEDRDYPYGDENGDRTWNDRSDRVYLTDNFIPWVEPIWTEDTCSFIGGDYETKEITRIKGTLTVVG